MQTHHLPATGRSFRRRWSALPDDRRAAVLGAALTPLGGLALMGAAWAALALAAWRDRD